jgi:hypothetical protein
MRCARHVKYTCPLMLNRRYQPHVVYLAVVDDAAKLLHLGPAPRRSYGYSLSAGGCCTIRPLEPEANRWRRSSRPSTDPGTAAPPARSSASRLLEMRDKWLCVYCEGVCTTTAVLRRCRQGRKCIAAPGYRRHAVAWHRLERRARNFYFNYRTPIGARQSHRTHVGIIRYPTRTN